jgi:putative chitinase
MITEEEFKTSVPDLNWEYFKPYVSMLEATLPAYNINTPIRTAHFLAQIAHESAGFRALSENLNYSAIALTKVFRKYFPTVESTAGFARIPEKIANKVYASRLGNGDEASGDGWKFRGRGLIQITGKNNYKLFSQATNQDFLASPDGVATPEYALSSACWFWKRKNINKYADQDDVHMVTKAVNGGFNGLPSREHFLQEFKNVYHIQST